MLSSLIREASVLPCMHVSFAICSLHDKLMMSYAFAEIRTMSPHKANALTLLQQVCLKLL